MRDYDYKNKWKKLLTPEIVSLLTEVHEYKGEQNLFIEANEDSLTELMYIAKIQSTEASNAIEGIYTSDDRLKKILEDKTMPKTRNEKEIAGYRDVLKVIHENFNHIPVKPSIVLQLHRDLYKFSGQSIGGQFKSSDNVIAEVGSNGEKHVRFQPVHSWETPDSINALCRAFEEVVEDESIDNLLIIPMFILDFLCIHPFNDGNGRMSRLLTLLLLYRSGYIVGKYISIEKIIANTKQTYYEVLYDSSLKWHEEENDYSAFVEYMLGIVISAYRDFSARVITLANKGLSKPERIAEVMKNNIGKITKAEILKKCPEVSDTTVQRTLNDLLKKEKIIKHGGGRYTSYTWNREGE